MAILLPAAAAAQPIICPVSTFADLPACIHPGQVIQVRTTGHKKSTGKVKSLGENHLELRGTGFWHRGTLRLNASEIDTIHASRAMSRTEGAVTGAMVGLGMGLGFATGASKDETAEAVALIVIPTAAFGVLGYWAPDEQFVLAFTRDQRKQDRAPRYAGERPPPEPPIARDFAGASIKTADDLRISLADGSHVRGRVIAMDDRVVVLDTGGHRVAEIDEKDVNAMWRRSHHPPSLKKAAVVSALVGAGLMAMAYASQGASDEPIAPEDRLTAGDGVLFVGFSAGVGMAVSRFMGHQERAVMVRPVSTPGVSRPTGAVVQWTVSLPGTLKR